MLRRLSLAAMAAITIFSAATVAQKKPSASYVPLTGTFRCPFEADCTGADGISGDVIVNYVGRADGTDGPTLNSNGDLYWPLKSGTGRRINLQFGAPLSTPPCAATNTCRKTFDSASITSSQPPSITNVVGDDGVSLPDGFRSIPVGTSVRGRYKFNFPDPFGRAFLWTIRFNSVMYPGSSDLTVTRTGENVWVVEASPEHIAELVSVPTSGRQTMVREGFYSMPFRVTVTR